VGSGVGTVAAEMLTFVSVASDPMFMKRKTTSAVIATAASATVATTPVEKPCLSGTRLVCV
jgi:hypothetical protein